MEEMLLAWMLDPPRMMEDLRLTPDPWQRSILESRSNRVMLLAARQSGKSTVTAVLALHRALLYPDSLILLFAPSLRQSSELFLKLISMYRDLDRPVEPVKELALSLDLANGSRIVTLPGDETTVRGYSAPSLVIVDEAARVHDDLIAAVSPMLAISGGRLLLLSTPVGRRGTFFELWGSPDPGWERIVARASECPRISREFLDEQRRTLGPRWYEQEFECAFVEAIDQCFSAESIDAAFVRTDHDDPDLEEWRTWNEEVIEA